MTKLHLKFADKVLKEIVLSQGVVTIGRLPDNLVHLDNPGVSDTTQGSIGRMTTTWSKI